MPQKSSSPSLRMVKPPIKADSRELDRCGEYGQVLVTPIGLRFPETMSYADWERAGRRLATISNSFMWCLGDWVAYGLEKYTDRYYQAIQAVGLDYKTLRNYTWVARRFKWSRRRADLSFQHHAEVAALPPEEQDQWLERAARHQWSRNQLREHLRAARGQVREDAPGVRQALQLVAIRPEQLDAWHKAAEQLGMSLQEWMLDVLDDAAHRTTYSTENSQAPEAERSAQASGQASG